MIENLCSSPPDGNSPMAGLCLHEIFARRAVESPDRIAVSDARTSLTYAQLNERANRLAHWLISHGAGPDELVGLCLGRTSDLIVGLLGILKAGAAYVPIDPTYPDSRIAYLLSDSEMRFIVCESHTEERVAGHSARTVRVDGAETNLAEQPSCNPQAAATPANLAYVIYTSGSTGAPKGVLIEHRSAVRLFRQTDAWFRFTPDDVFSMFHSISFDFSVWEIWGALLYGGEVVIVPFDVSRNPSHFFDYLIERKITILSQTPSAFRQLLTPALTSTEAHRLALRSVVFGGERLDLSILEPWIKRFGDARPKLINMYGITETTVHVSYRRIVQADLTAARPSPIGIAIPDLNILLLDDNLLPVEDGAIGTMYIAGDGLARGYHNLPELTAERFLTLRLANGGSQRVYNSGDRAIRWPNGEFSYIGRADDQLKIRGFRIEPREIEACLLECPEIISCVIKAHDHGDGDMRLVAYVIPAPGNDAAVMADTRLERILADHAVRGLPAHMWPSLYIPMREFPLTPHGKIDRDSLPKPAALAQPAILCTTELSDVETQVKKIWDTTLEYSCADLDLDFFIAGGTSLAVLGLVFQIEQHFGIRTDLLDRVYGQSSGTPLTIRSLAALVEDIKSDH